MNGSDLILQLFALLLGLAVAELLAGLARSWRIRVGATRAGAATIRIGWLVPLLALLVLCDQTHFWLTAYALRGHIGFDYATLLGVLAIIGGYYVVSTFVFPDDPADWPDFDDYYQATNRTVIAGMLVINLATLIYVLFAAVDLRIADAPLAQSPISLGAALLFPPGLLALWFAKSRRANFVLLILLNVTLLVGAIGPKMTGA